MVYIPFIKCIADVCHLKYRSCCNSQGLNDHIGKLFYDLNYGTKYILKMVDNCFRY